MTITDEGSPANKDRPLINRSREGSSYLARLRLLGLASFSLPTQAHADLVAASADSSAMFGGISKTVTSVVPFHNCHVEKA